MGKPLKILYKYTSKSRPTLFFRGLDSIVNNSLDKENYHVLCSFDLDDSAMNNPEVLQKLNSYQNITYFFGKSKSKIDAINRDLDKVLDFDILINMSDDMVFTSMFFDRVIRQAFLEHFPDTDGFLHFHDGNQERLATMSIIGKKHFDRTGLIYPSDYLSVYCDNHVQDYAQLVGKYHYMGDHIRIMNHLHPIHGKAQFDAQYLRTEHRSVYQKDRSTYISHKANNFGL